MVRVVRADRSPESIVTEVVGTVRSVREATIAPLVSGTVTEVRVGLGSVVRAGDVLVRISANEAEARLAQARAVSALAERERDRAASLSQERAMTAAQYEAAASHWSVARAQEDEARTIVSRTWLHAPFDGVITAKLINVGEAAFPGRPMVTVESRAVTRFEAHVPEAVGDALVVGGRLQVRVEGLPSALEGRVAEVQPASDETTRARLVKIDLPPTPGLRPGQFGRALLATGHSVAVTVPADALLRHGQLESVFVVDAGRARLRLVRCGRELDGRVQITSGLSGGETLALAPAAISDGQPVKVTP
jgi:RND family efflux transporter MFP subunit